MTCPKCKGDLSKDGNYRYKCDVCGFRCGLSFFYDDDHIAFKKQTGLSVDEPEPSQQSVEVSDSGALGLNDLDQVTELEKLSSVQDAQRHEDELEELNALMRDVPGQSAAVHRHLTSGESYRKTSSGGVIGHKVG